MRRPMGLALATALLSGPAAGQDGWLAGDIAVLQGLDKVTARITTIEAPLDRPLSFGTLEINARSCFKRPPEDPPESAAYLEIREVRPNEEPVVLFSGWMFASSPALSALEHAVYDVWVLDCASAAEQPPASTAPQ